MLAGFIFLWVYPLVLVSPVKPTLLTSVGAALTQVAISKSSSFGYKGQAFIGAFGTLAPQTHLTAASPYGPYIGTVMGKIIGQNVIVFDPVSGTFHDFLTLNTAAGNFRPTGLQFSPDGKALYIASMGINEVRTITPSGAILPYPLGLPYLLECCMEDNTYRMKLMGAFYLFIPL